MGTFTPYKDSIFSENLKYVIFRDTDLVGVTVKVTVSIVWKTNIVRDMEDIEYDVKVPDSGEISFNVAEMLRPFRTADKRPLADIYDMGQAPEVSITVRDTGEEYSWSREMIIGGFDDSVEGGLDAESVRLHQFFTARPQIDETVPGLPQKLTVSMDGQIDGHYYSEKHLMARIYFREHAPLEVVHTVIPRHRGSGAARATYSHSYTDVGYGTVRALADEEGIEDEIVAYDLWGTLAFDGDDGEETVYSNVPYPQRFIVRRARAGWSYFMFLNGLDGIDTLIARGRARDMVEGETDTFVNQDVEAEVANDARRYREVNTGYIRSREYRDLWFEFFRSPLRAVADLDGNVRDIVVDEYTAEYNDTGEVASFTFKYHLTERELTALPVRGEITRPVEEDTVPVDERSALEVSPAVFRVPADGGSVGLSLKSSAAWSAEVEDEYGMGVSVSPDEGVAGIVPVSVSVSGRAARAAQSAAVVFSDLWGNIARLRLDRPGQRICEFFGEDEIVLNGDGQQVSVGLLTNAEKVRLVFSGLAGRIALVSMDPHNGAPVSVENPETAEVDVCGEMDGATGVTIGMMFSSGYAGVSGEVTIIAVFGDEEVIAGKITVTEDRAYGPVVIDSLSWPDIPASGGTVEPVLKYHQDWGYDGATSGGGTLTSGADVMYVFDGSPAESGAVTAGSKGIAVSGRTAVKQGQVVVSLNGKSATSSAVSVYQAANALESTTADIVLNPSKGDDVNDMLPASGYSGGLSCNITVNETYTSGAVNSYVPKQSGPNDTSHLASLTSSADWLHVGATVGGNGGTTQMTADSRGTVEGPERSAEITATYMGCEGTVTVWQEENYPTTSYEIEAGFNDGDSGVGSESNPVPAGGGQVGLDVHVYKKTGFPGGTQTVEEIDMMMNYGFWNAAEFSVLWMSGQLVGVVYGIIVQANSGAARTGTVRFRYGGAMLSVTVYQAGADE